MRSRQCNKLASICCVVGVFAAGMLCGIYYEAVSADTHAAVRAAETSNINGGKKVDLNHHIKIQPEPGKNNIIAKKPVVKTEDTKVKSKEPIKTENRNIQAKTGEVNSLRRGDVQFDVGKIDKHHADINRKEFGHPIRLKPNAPVPPLANRQPGQDSDDLHKQQQQLKQAHLQQQQQPNQQAQQQQQVQQPKQKAQQQQQQFAQQEHVPQQQQNAQQRQVPQQQPQQWQKLNIQAANQKPQPNLPQANQHVAQPAPMPAAVMPGIKPQVAGQDLNQNTDTQLLSETIPKVNGKITLSVVVCGDRTDEALTMVKSAAVLTSSPVHFHIFAEEVLQANIAAKLKSWPQPYSTKITFDLHPIAFPPGENAEEWKKMFKKCATQRLFLPDLLKDTDALLYVDTDILFIKPLEFIWSFFKKFNSTQLAALTPEHEVTNIGWYNRFARHPFYGPTGLNSGVMLMNLTRMRNFGWSAKILPIYREYKMKITWGDQDLLNILFHFHPELVYVYQCEWNIRPDHCMYSLNCHRIEKEGIAVIHGNRGVYHNDKQLPFRIIYEAFQDYKFGTDMCSGLVQPLKQRFAQPDISSMYCSKGLHRPLIATLQNYCQHQH